MWKRNTFFGIIVLVFTSFNYSTAQDNNVDSSAIRVNRKGKVIVKTGDELYFGVSPGFSNRTLTQNPGLFSKPLGERENEYGGWFYSFHVGYRAKLHQLALLDIGFEYSRNGEFYDTPGDTIYSYKNTYHHIGIPLKVAFQYGNKLKLHVAGGFVPKMFLNQTTMETIGTQFGGVEEVKTKYKEGYNFFNVDAVISLGFRWQSGRNLGIYVLPEARWQLFNTYGKQSSYIHKSFVLGISAGIFVML